MTFETWLKHRQNADIKLHTCLALFFDWLLDLKLFQKETHTQFKTDPNWILRQILLKLTNNFKTLRNRVSDPLESHFFESQSFQKQFQTEKWTWEGFGIAFCWICGRFGIRCRRLSSPEGSIWGIFWIESVIDAKATLQATRVIAVDVINCYYDPVRGLNKGRLEHWNSLVRARGTVADNISPSLVGDWTQRLTTFIGMVKQRAHSSWPRSNTLWNAMALIASPYKGPC